MDIQERITVVLELVTKGFKEKSNIVANSINNLKKNVGGFNKVMHEPMERFKVMNGRMKAMHTIGGKLAYRIRQLTHGTRGFRMEFLGLMFAGMALTRMMTGLLQPAMDAFGIMDLWSIMLLVLFIPLMEMLLPIFLAVTNFFMNLPEPVQKVIGVIVLILLVIGVLIMMFGMLGLAIGSFILVNNLLLAFLGISLMSVLGIILLVITSVILIVSGFVDIFKGKWEGLGKIIMGIGVILFLFIGWWALLVVAVGFAVYMIIKHWSGIKHFFVQLWNSIKLIFLKAVKFLFEVLSFPLRLLSYLPGMGFIGEGLDKAMSGIQDSIDKINADMAAEEVRRGMEKIEEANEKAMKKVETNTGSGMTNVTNAFSTGMTNSELSMTNGMDNMNSEWLDGMQEMYSTTDIYVDKINKKLGKLNPGVYTSSSGGYVDELGQGMSMDPGSANYSEGGHPITYSPPTISSITNSNPYNDFIWRPGSGAASISPSDTLVGVKDTSKLGGSNSVVINQNITLNANNKDEFTRMIRDANAKLLSDVQRLVGA